MSKHRARNYGVLKVAGKEIPIGNRHVAAAIRYRQDENEALDKQCQALRKRCTALQKESADVGVELAGLRAHWFVALGERLGIVPRRKADG